MNQDFYRREQELRQHDDRQRAHAEKHQTLETLQIEQNAAQDGISAPMGEEKKARQGFLARLKKRFS